MEQAHIRVKSLVRKPDTGCCQDFIPEARPFESALLLIRKCGNYALQRERRHFPFFLSGRVECSEMSKVPRSRGNHVLAAGLESDRRTVSILIADDHPVLRRGLCVLLETQPGWKVVSVATNGREAVENAVKLRPDIAILDIGMPKLNGIDATALISKASPKTRILILTMHAAKS
jgi:PleD family two-component response regulator